MATKTNRLKELRSLFFQIRCLMRERLPDSSRDANTWLRMEVLRFVADHPGCAQNEIAQFTHVAASSASALLAVLVRARYIRKKEAADRRSARLFLTQKGRTELKQVERLSMQALTSVFGGLSDRDILKLSNLLRSVVR